MKLTQTPKPERISQWGSATEIIYQCRACGGSFSFYGKNEKFCHNCGCENDWSKIPTHLSEESAKRYHAADFALQREMMKQLDTMLNIPENSS